MFIAKRFSKVVVSIYILTNSVWGVAVIPSFPWVWYWHIGIGYFLILDFLAGVEWYLIVVLICISLVTNEVWNIFICWWQFGCALLWSAHVSLLQCFLIFFKNYLLEFCCVCILTPSPLLVYVLQISAPILWLAFSLS